MVENHEEQLKDEPEDAPEEGSVLKFPTSKENIIESNPPAETKQIGKDEKNDNILRADFSKKKGKSKGVTPPKKPVSSVMRDLALHLLATPEDVKETEWKSAIKKARDEIVPFLESLKGIVSKKVYHDSFATISKFSNQALMEAVLNSNETDWRAKPAYYSALSEETFLRVRNTNA